MPPNRLRNPTDDSRSGREFVDRPARTPQAAPVPSDAHGYPDSPPDVVRERIALRELTLVASTVNHAGVNLPGHVTVLDIRMHDKIHNSHTRVDDKLPR